VPQPTSPVEIVDYDPNWPGIFRQLEERIWPVVRDVAVAIEHVGSTAVPGMAAKPVVDVDIVIKAQADLPAIIDRLASLGYRHRGNLGVEGRDAFAMPEDLPAHHLYVCVQDCAALQNHIALREYLRANPSEAAAYSELKKQLAEQFHNERELYGKGKTGFVMSVLERCGLAPEALAQIKQVN
jgi:GrpB-like predicted nucleotidyltransferase (UPF0157 family)